MSSALAAIGSKLELLKQVEAEHGFGAIIKEPRELAAIPSLPESTTDVFSLFHRLGGDYFRFQQSASIANPQAWADRPINPYCPLGNPLRIGGERYGAPADIECGSGIYLDLLEGDVYFCDGDDYVFAYKHTDVEIVETTELAPDILTFFDFHVLGEGYPQLIASVLGDHAVNSRKRGRHRDSWMRLLEKSGLASATSLPAG
jgi:hypothetical protein